MSAGKGRTLLEVISEAVTSGATRFTILDGEGREFEVTVGERTSVASHALAGESDTEVAAEQERWDNWLLSTRWPFDWNTPDALPPTTADRMGKVWNRDHNWGISDDEAADTIASESGLAREPATGDDPPAATGRCEARTTHQGGPVPHQIRCDLTAGHPGRHELLNRSDGALVTSWAERGDRK